MALITQEDLTLSVLRNTSVLQGVPTAFVPTLPLVPVPVAPIKAPPIVLKTLATPTSPGANPSGKNGIPLPVLTMQAAQTPVKLQTSTECLVQVNFTVNSQDSNFSYVEIWFAGYHGNSQPQLMATAFSSPATFTVDATQETVVVYAQTASDTGLTAPLAFALHTTLFLSGQVAAPPAPTISQSLVGTPTGYQFGFNQVVLPSNDQEVISGYNIYRAELNIFADAVLQTTIVANPNLTGSLTFTDTIVAASGVAYYYWVTAFNTAGFESTPTPAQSGQVVGSIGSIPLSISTPFIITPTTTTLTLGTSPSCFFTRADGTKTMIGQTSQAITGLINGITYRLYPYWNETTQALAWVKATDIVIPSITGITLTAASDQYVKTATSTIISSSFSVELWVKATAQGALFDLSDPTTVGTTTLSLIQCWITAAGEVQIGVYDTASSIWAPLLTTAGAQMLGGQWKHVVFSFNSATNFGTLYVDGQNTSDGVTLWTSAFLTPTSGTGCFWHFGVCAKPGSGQGPTAPLSSTTYLSGSISHAAIYATALPQTQAASNFQAYFNLGESLYLQELTYGLATNLWKFAETSGTTSADSIGTNTGTYVASPTLNQTSPVITVSGTPALAFPFNDLLSVQFQALRNNVPLSNGPILATTSSTSTPISGGGGYGGYNYNYGNLGPIS